MCKRLLGVVSTLLCAFWLLPMHAQETRSMLFGRVLDPQSSPIVGAQVSIRNVDTGVKMTLTTNDTGYYEGNLLMPGQYEVTAENQGFKRLVRKGITLPVSSRLEVDLLLVLGTVTETVAVSAEAPMLETNAVSSGRVLDNKTVMELPVMGNSAMQLVKLAPGIQTSGVNNYLALHSNAGGSDYSVGGNIGGNSWTLDGSPNQGPGRRTAYLPYTDAVAEFKVETNNFDAGIGQTSGAAITMISKSGTNDFHGTATWQHWQQRWQGTPFFVKQNYYTRIAQAEAAGNSALANQLRNTDKQPTGRSNNWGVSGGGPVIIPKLYNGRNKLFWFFTYNGFKDVKVEDASTFNRIVPTLKAREGDFSEMLALRNNPSRYVVHDPTSVRQDPARPANFIRDPFPGNVIPRSRFANPAYNKIRDLYPNPNIAIAPGDDPNPNYLANQTPYNWDYAAYSNRVDYQINDKWRVYGRWSVNNFGPEDRGDWTYETARGLNLNGLVRNNKGGNIDLIYTQNATTIWNFNAALNQFREGNIQPKALEFKPTDIGLPQYLNDKAGDLALLPLMNVSGYTQISPGGYSTWTRTRQATMKLELTKIVRRHTMRAGYDNRNMFRTGGGGGNTSGNFTFNDQYVRRNDDSLTPSSNLGLAWAAFILGVPSGASIATNDTYAMHNPYHGAYFQDSWRVTNKLTLNLGLRMEYELGPTERYDRMIGRFDPTLSLPISAAAQAAYAANPLAQLPASQFKVLGGSTYVGTGNTPRRWFQNQLMWLPRVGVAYALNSKTVFRGGFGTYYDTLNVMNFGPDQFNFSRSTNAIISTNAGVTWGNGLYTGNASPANGGSILNNPFPVRQDGTRFDVPTRNALGSMAVAGRGFSYTNFNQPHARQQRWRAGVQRQIGESLVLDIAYSGSYSDQISLSRNDNFMPENYWAKGLARDVAPQNFLNANVPNPFNINNFTGANIDPLVLTDMRSNGFFTGAIVQRQRLLRAFPHMTGVTNNQVPVGYTRSDELQISVDRRFRGGWNFNFGYTAMKLREADFFANEWERTPTERISNDGRPHRVVATAIYEVPFGKGRKLFANMPTAVNHVLGGWQAAVTYEWQPGPLLDWGGNIFYYSGDPNSGNIRLDQATFDRAINTDGVGCTNRPAQLTGFERCANLGAAAYHARTFPTRLNDIRRDMTNQWNANMSKNLKFMESWTMQLRLDAINLTNRSQMNGPNLDPSSSNFGRIQSQTAATNRWIQVQARLTF